MESINPNIFGKHQPELNPIGYRTGRLQRPSRGFAAGAPRLHDAAEASPPSQTGYPRSPRVARAAAAGIAAASVEPESDEELDEESDDEELDHELDDDESDESET